MKTIDCYEVLGHTDTTEGRAPMKVVARFSDYGQAEKFVKSKDYYAQWCVWGRPNEKYDLSNIRRTTIVILDSVEELAAASQQELKQQALSKLSPAERSALGF